MIKHAVISGFLSKTRDRFHEYNEEKTPEERIRMVAEMHGIDGVEMVYPYEVSDPVRLKDMLSQNGVGLAAINVNIKAEPEFRDGGLTSGEKGVRDKAVRFIKEAKDFAHEAGADKVTCCPLGDGYEFCFQSDYAEAWKRLVETFGEAGSHRRDVPLFIEYKPSESRGRCFIDTAAKSLCLLGDIGVDEIGVTLDFGHSVYGNENPAEALSLLAGSRFPYYIHINDNDGRWDWDYFVGTKHFLDYIEFLYYLQKYGYNDYVTSDTSPTRWDIKRTFEANARVTNKIWERLNAVDRNRLEDLMASGDYLDTWRFIEHNFLGL